jgi:hypothetical protein
MTTRTITVDMSSDAIDRRLREVGRLYKLGMSFRRAKRIGRVRETASPYDKKTGDEG